MAVKVIIPDDKWILTRLELTDLFGLHWQTHEARFRAPMFPREDVVLGNNQYDLKAYIEWMINVYFAAKDSDAMFKEKLRHEKYKADKAMYDAEERARLLLPRDEVVSGLSLLLSGIKNKFLEWVKRMPGLLAMKTARQIEPILQKELFLILSDLAKGIALIVPKMLKEKLPAKRKEKKVVKKKGKPKKKV
jgi:hypothetical protein